MNTLIIFAKYPQGGQVKTRLAKRVGEDKAALMYKDMVETVVAETKSSLGLYKRVLYFDPPDREKAFKRWIRLDGYFPQASGDLGVRMQTAFIEQLINKRHVVLIGTDCIDLNESFIMEAYRQLQKNDLVIGPATDGGYYLIGCKKFIPQIFEGISWSTDKVFKQTMTKAKQLKLSVGLLPELSDIDT